MCRLIKWILLLISGMYMFAFSTELSEVYAYDIYTVERLLRVFGTEFFEIRYFLVQQADACHQIVALMIYVYPDAAVVRKHVAYINVMSVKY